MAFPTNSILGLLPTTGAEFNQELRDPLVSDPQKVKHFSGCQDQQADTTNLTHRAWFLYLFIFTSPCSFFPRSLPATPTLTFYLQTPQPQGSHPKTFPPHRPRWAPAPRAGPTEPPPRVARPRASLTPVSPHRAEPWQSPPGAGDEGTGTGGGCASPLTSPASARQVGAKAMQWPQDEL